MKKTIDQLCKDNQILYKNSEDLLKVVEVLTVKIKEKNKHVIAFENCLNDIKFYKTVIEKQKVDKNI